MIRTDVAAHRAERVRKPSCGRAIDHHDIIGIADLGQRFANSGEKHRVVALTRHQRFGRLVLELHEFELPRNDVQVRNVGASHDLRHFAAVGIIADGAVNRLVLADIKFGLVSEQR